MAEYEMTAFRDDKAEYVETMLFGSRPSDEWVHKLSERSDLEGTPKKQGLYNGGDIHLNYDNGYIVVRKHIKNFDGPPATKRTNQ